MINERYQIRMVYELDAVFSEKKQHEEVTVIKDAIIHLLQDQHPALKGKVTFLKVIERFPADSILLLNGVLPLNRRSETAVERMTNELMSYVSHEDIKLGEIDFLKEVVSRIQADIKILEKEKENG